MHVCVHVHGEVHGEVHVHGSATTAGHSMFQGLEPHNIVAGLQCQILWLVGSVMGLRAGCRWVDMVIAPVGESSFRPILHIGRTSIIIAHHRMFGLFWIQGLV